MRKRTVPNESFSGSKFVLYTTKNIFQTIIFLIILHEGVDTCLGCAHLLSSTTWAERKSIRITRLRIGQSCRAVCTKKSGLPQAIEMHTHYPIIGAKRYMF